VCEWNLSNGYAIRSDSIHRMRSLRNSVRMSARPVPR
jgi:hypothetical protein